MDYVSIVPPLIVKDHFIPAPQGHHIPPHPHVVL